MAKKFEPVHPSRKGEFTDAAKNAHMSPAEFAHHVLGHEGDYSSERVHQAEFDLAQKKWKH